jgi:hypothetical protein
VRLTSLKYWPSHGLSRTEISGAHSPFSAGSYRVRHLGRSMNELRAGMSAAPLMAAARIAVASRL